MVTVVVLLVALAAAQGIYNLLKDARHDFSLIDPLDEGTPLVTENRS